MSRALGAMPILAGIPEDQKVLEAEREGVPVVVYEPGCPASVAINDLAKVVIGEACLPYTPSAKNDIDETIRRLTRALTGQRV
jgi:MinD-like ATPase involved in chromosome partitioning or flagellar assembly